MSEHYMDKEAVLHIYGQWIWHDSAVIAGNKAGLMALRDAIQRVLVNGADSKAIAEVFVIDGEGYDIQVFLENTSDIASRKLPYTDPDCHTGENPDDHANG